MPRVTTVKSARKAQGSCGKCGAKIKRGDAYRWWKFRYGGKYVRCEKPECAPKASDLTQSAFYSQLYSIQDTVSDAISAFEDGGEPDDLASALREAADELRSLGEECQSNHDNMPDSLQYSETGELLQTRADECESKASELESAADDLESLDLYDDPEAFAEERGLSKELDETDGAFEGRIAEAMDEANDETKSGAVPDVDLTID